MAHNALPLLLRVFAAKLHITLANKLSSSSSGAVFATLIAFVWGAASVPSASAQAVSYAGSGAVNFGTANVCTPGKTVPAPCSQAMTLTYNVTESGTLGTPQALTTGAPNLDYKVASGSNCVGGVTQGNTCKVNVTFSPIQPGARNGAVEVVDSNNNVLAATFIYGIGVGPEVGFVEPAQRTINVPDLASVAVDGNGNIFVVANPIYLEPPVVEELLAVNGTVPANPVVKVLAQVYGSYAGTGRMAVDGAGNLFVIVSDYVNSTSVGGYIQEFFAADGYTKSKFIPIGGPGDFALDGSGNIFLSQNFYSNSAYTKGLFEILADGGYTTVNTIFNYDQYNSIGPQNVALDLSGNLYFVDQSSGSLFELTIKNGNQTFREINTPGIGSGAIAFDPAGNLFSAGGPTIVEYLAVDGVLPAKPAEQRFATTNQPYELAFDSRGNLYTPQDTLLELQLSMPGTLSFPETVVGKTSSNSPQSIQLENEGNAPLDLTGISLDSSNWELVKGSGTPEDCTSSTALVPSALCNISISFEPKEAGPLTGAVTLTDNSLNAPGSQQSILLNGTGTSTPHITSLNTTYGAPYSVIYVNGSNFSTSKGSNIVTFNGVAAPVYYSTGTFILATVPGKATTGNLVVTVGGEASNAIPFTVLPMPKVTGISPTTGPTGTIVTISGVNLVDYENHGKVGFNGRYLPILSETSTAIQVAVPTGAVTDHFHVLVNDTGMNTATFSVTP